THSSMATNTPAIYSATALANRPRGYWKLNEPAYTPPDPTTLPITANAGTLGAAARGTNHPGLTAGVAGPVGGGVPGNAGADTLYLAGNVDLGTSVGLNCSNQTIQRAW